MTSPPLRLAFACALVIATSCRPSERESAALPPEPQVVDIEMAEYRFSYDPPVVPGRVLFRVRNTGRVAHSLSVLPLSEDVAPIDQQLRGSRRLGIVPFAGVGTRKPGESTTFAVDLAPGLRYALICFRQDPKGRSHALLGMNSEFRTGSGRGASTIRGSSSTSSGPPPSSSPELRGSS